MGGGLTIRGYVAAEEGVALDEGDEGRAFAGMLAMTGRLIPEPDRAPGSTACPLTVMAGGGGTATTPVPVVAP
jgi:hypothetical protein